MAAAEPFRSVDELIDALGGATRAFDEPGLDVLAHSLQCAAILHARHPDDPELAVAGLVHDVADTVYPDHTDHEHRGAALVRSLLGPRVAKLVGAHVLAKRYLVTTEPSYRSALSDRSGQTLATQGDALDARGCAQLERDPDFDAIVALRRADESAKDPAARPPALAEWRPLLEALARA